MVTKKKAPSEKMFVACKREYQEELEDAWYRIDNQDDEDLRDLAVLEILLESTSNN